MHIAIHFRCGWRDDVGDAFLQLRQHLRLRCAASRSGSVSGARIGIMKSVEMTKLTASSATAYGAVSTPMRTPARPGPPICAADTVVCSFEFPSTSWSRSTSDGQVRLVRDVEEDGADADHELQHHELPDVEDPDRPRDRDVGEEHGARGVACDQDRAAAQAVDPDAGGQREEHERQEAEQRRGRRTRAASRAGRRGEPRDREPRDLRAELADRLAGPELEEVAVTPEPAGRAAQLTHRVPS